jgi:hypothetical protein
MTGASASQKQAFINAYNRMVNLRGSNEAAFQKRIDDAIARANAWARANGRSGITNIERRIITQAINSTKQRQIMDTIIRNDRANGNRLFGGKIRTRNLTKADYRAHGGR